MTFFELGSDLVLRAGEHVVRLTPIESRAFRYLASRAGTVVRREALEQDVWGIHPEVSSEAVPVALRGLRKKLGPHRELLETVRSVGWRLHDRSGPLWTTRRLMAALDTEAVMRFRDQQPQLLAGLETVPLEEVEELASRLVSLARLVLPEQVEPTVRAALRRRPASLTVRLLAARFTEDLDAVEKGLAHADVQVRFHAVQALRLLRPARVDPDQLEGLREELDGADRLQLEGYRLSYRLVRSDEQALAELDALLEEARVFPALRVSLLVTFGLGLWRLQAFARAVLLFDAAIEGAEAMGLDPWLAHRLRAMSDLHLSAERRPDVAALLEVASSLRASGRTQVAAEAHGYAALVLAGAGDWAGLEDVLRQAGGSPSMARIVVALRDVSGAIAGDGACRERIQCISAEPFLAVGEHTEFADFLAAWLPELLAAADGDVNAWGRIAENPHAADNAESILLRRLARIAVI